MHLTSPPFSDAALRGEFDAWVADGPACLSSVLTSAGSARVSGPKARVLEPIEPVWFNDSSAPTREETAPRCFQWVHLPSLEKGRPDIVAVVFTMRDDLLRW